MLRRFLLALSTVSLVFLACGGRDDLSGSGTCSVLATEYDQSCVSDSDCVLVPPGGNVCDPCTRATEQPGAYYFFCNVAVVSANDSARYLAAIAPGQTGVQSGLPSCGSSCPPAAAACVNGRCATKPYGVGGEDGGS